MATTATLQAQALDVQKVRGLSPAPVGHGKDRRASLVIKETQQLLNGLHEDADRSNALMAELEKLLQDAHQASGLAAPRSTDRSDATTGPQISGSVHFASVEPLQDDMSSDGEEDATGSDEDEEPECRKAAPRAAHPTGPVRVPSEKRRSSVITFDGGCLFAGPSPSPGSALTAANTSGAAASALRAPSFSRVRSQIQSGKSWTEGSRGSIRRSALTDAGGSSVLVGVSGASFCGGRRSSATDVQQDPYGTPSAAYAVQQRRASSLAYSGAPPVSVGQLSFSQMRSANPSVEGDGAFDGGGGGEVVAGGGGRGGVAVMSAPSQQGGGSGRFLRIIKGMFQAHNDHRRPSAGAPSAPAPAPTSTSGASQRAPTSTDDGLSSPLDSARLQGALSGMTLTLTPPAPPQQPPLLYAQSPSGAAAAAAAAPGSALQPLQSLRAPSRGSAHLVATRSFGASSGGPLHVAVPPPGDPPSRGSPRVTVPVLAAAAAPSSAAGSAAAAAAGLHVVRRSASMTMGMHAAMMSATGGAAAAGAGAIVGGAGPHVTAALLSAGTSPVVLSPNGSATLSPGAASGGGGGGGGFSGGLPWSSPSSSQAVAADGRVSGPVLVASASRRAQSQVQGLQGLPQL